MRHSLLMQDDKLRRRMGEQGRKRVVENYDYRIVAKRFIELVSEHMEIS